MHWTPVFANANEASDQRWAFAIHFFDGGTTGPVPCGWFEPGRDFRQFAAAILNPGVVIADNANCCAQFNIPHLATTPDEEGVVRQRLRSAASADDDAILDLPQLRVTVPTREIFAIEQRSQAVLGKDRGRKSREQEKECSR